MLPGMDEKRVNNTDPVDQVRLRVMIGNFHGAIIMVRLVAGSVFIETRPSRRQAASIKEGGRYDGQTEHTARKTPAKYCRELGGTRRDTRCTGCNSRVFLVRLEDEYFACHDLIGAEIGEPCGVDTFECDALEPVRFDIFCERQVG